ncbi:hypothetical protein [Pseudomonas putida]|uniref:Uncharacterized protein n=1 Tax=Pseudomonas putida TaxID=303 RepID=A0A1X1A296_PSEPU|nr:hypothetical protein [Pseudomonas putida]ORL66289.1 hypothetical protein B7H17_05965 [Pseudomonas putida]
MSNDFAAPEIPALGGGESLDLKSLNGNDLDVLFTYDEIDENDYCIINFRGRSADGRNLVYKGGGIVGELDDRKYATMWIPNAQLEEFSGGWGFVSVDQDDGFGKLTESGLAFFYVDKAADTVRTLPPAQVIGGNGLRIDRDREPGDAMVVVGPYAAMAVDDKVKYFWYGQDKHGKPLGPISLQHVITAQDIGKPLLWLLDGNELHLASEGQGEVSYTIDYADSATGSQSPRQLLRIVQGEPEGPKLPSPRIEGLTGDHVDPGAYPDGIVVQADDYGMQLDDEVVLHVYGRAPTTCVVQVDVSILQSGKIRFGLGHDWLQANTSGRVTLVYQFSRLGTLQVSEALSLTIGTAPVLPAPTVDGVEFEGDAKGSLTPERAVNVRIPKEVEARKFEMIAVNRMGDRFPANPTLGGDKTFQFPMEVIAANLGQRLELFYSFKHDDGTVEYSKAYDLGIRNVVNPNHFKRIECKAAKEGKLSLSTVPEEGVLLELPMWQFSRPEQPVRIQAMGHDAGGAMLPVEIVRDDLPLTLAERQAGKVQAYMAKRFVQSLKLNDTFRIRAAVSFDEGRSFKTLPALVLTLVP